MGLQVSFHGWQVRELLSTVATLPSDAVEIKDCKKFQVKHRSAEDSKIQFQKTFILLQR